MLDEAVKGFAESYQQYPTPAKAPDSLLMLGRTFGPAEQGA